MADSPPNPHARVWTTAWTAIGFVAVLALLYIVAAATSPGSNPGIPAASAIVLISAAALGIERVMEVFWTLVDSTGGSFWPLTSIDRAVNNLANSIGDASEGPLAKSSLRGTFVGHGPGSNSLTRSSADCDTGCPGACRPNF